ncbi:hypothetical protein N0V83_010797 [Neocucurbitaria cava]|uniref:RRM domain-containing protein n=1 Tax=Neocucurbitaria cava TaxID=798079 RepID=A0A9W8XXS7_9PLEO|nr:hypothetical protein N0V83_010797 [Neocucurbitaria cava]
MSTTIHLDCLPWKSESSFVLTFFSNTDQAKIKEIHTYPGGSDCAWVIFKTHEDAKAAVTKYNDRHFGPNGKKVYTSLSTESAISTNATNRLMQDLHDRENQVESRTVKITNLPEKHTLRNLNQIFDPMIEEYDSFVRDPDFPDYEPSHILHVKSPEPGVGLVQLETPDMAITVVFELGCRYWKNATLNARCVPDEEMERLLPHRSADGEKDVMLFVSGIKPGTSKSEVEDIFKDFSINDVNIPPGTGKTFCFVFLHPADAGKVLAMYENGVRHQGKMVWVSRSDKNKKKSGDAGLSEASPVLPVPVSSATTDLKVNKLPIGVAESDIHLIFQDFTISKVVIKHGHVYVGVASDERERALRELNGKKIGDQYITVKVSERSKN